MRSPEDHLPFNLIADLADGQATLSDDTREHLATCARCAADLAWLQRLIDLARGAAFEEPPAEAVKRVKAMLRERRPVVPLGPRLLQALLRFDSAFSAPAFGLRAAGSLERQILLDAEGYVVDLRVTPADGRLAISGQLLAPPDAPAAPAAAELLGVGGEARAALNELSEFVLPPVPPGRYSLTITVGDRAIFIPGLDLGA